MLRVKTVLAKTIRILTVPPVLVLSLLLILFFAQRDMFSSLQELLFTLLFLMLVPILAYPAAFVLPRFKRQGREGQRKLAFIFSLVGYTGAIIYGTLAHVEKTLLVVQFTYFISVWILTFFNKVVKLRASGHACSFSGPLAVLIWQFGWSVLLPCVLVFLLILWASVFLKRHTPGELLMGSLSSILAFFLSLLLVSIL